MYMCKWNYNTSLEFVFYIIRITKLLNYLFKNLLKIRNLQYLHHIRMAEGFAGPHIGLENVSQLLYSIRVF